MRYSAAFLLLACACGVGSAEGQDAITSRAVALVEGGDFKNAAAILRPVLGRTPDKPDLWNLLGICESELKHSTAAKEAFQKGLKLDPTSVSLNENFGNLLFTGGEYADAKKFLMKAIALGSANPGVAFSLAASRIRTGEEKQGLALLRDLEA